MRRIFPASDCQYSFCPANFESSSLVRFGLSLLSPYSDSFGIFQIFAFSRIFGKYAASTPIDKWSSLLPGSVIHCVMGSCYGLMLQAHVIGSCQGLMSQAYVTGLCHGLM